MQKFCPKLSCQVLFISPGMDLQKFSSKRSRIAKVQPSKRPASRSYFAAMLGAPRPVAGKQPGGDNESLHNSWDPNERDWSKAMCRGAHGRMRVLFVGHNPSQRSWEATAPYAHKSNSFWKLIREAGFAPPDLCAPQKFNKFPRECNIGFADLFVTMGSLASDVKEPPDPHWRTNEFCPRIVAATGGLAPHVIACVSKSVAEKLLKGWKGAYGPVGTGAKWKLVGLEDCMVWVLPSSSGRAVLKWEDRLEPFQRLAKFVDETFPARESVSDTEDASVAEAIVEIQGSRDVPRTTQSTSQ